MKMHLRLQIMVLAAAVLLSTLAGAQATTAQTAKDSYTPAPENLKARTSFQDAKFGMFIHWGVYSVLGDGERITRRCRRFSIQSSLIRQRGWRWQKPRA